MIQFDIGFKVDAKSLEGQLNTIHKEIQNAFKVDAGFSGGMSKEISNAVVQARSLEKALQAATTDKGLSFSSMNAELRKAGTNMNQVVSGLIAGGDAFKGSANEALTSFASANRQVITLNKHLQEMGRVFLQSMKFTVAQQAIQGLQNMLQESYEWVVDLDSQLTQIQIVSGKTAQQMEAVSAQIVERSRALKVAASDYAEASQIYYQQGLQDAEVQRRADITIKAAQAANESTKSMSDMLTAIWNTYNMQGAQLENAASVAAKLGAETAIEFGDIAEAMQISATAASQMGVSYNSLASIIATVGSTTRQSASVIGNAYKTIFNNFQRLKVDGENGEVTLKAASQQLQALGINLLDASGQVKDLDEVIMQAGENWKNYSENEQLAIAQLVGGTRQFGQFLALMNNFDTYLANLNSANMETGAETLEEQYSIAMESIEAKATNAAEAWQRAFSNFYDTDGIKDLIDLIADLGNMTSDAVEAFGGLDGIVQIIMAMAATQLPKAFSKAKSSVTDFMDSVNPQRRRNRIISDVNAQFRPAQNKVQSQLATSTEPRNSAYIKNLQVENSLLERKAQVTKEAALEQDKLNSLIVHGTPQQQAVAEALKEESIARHANIMQIEDEIAALNKLRNTQGTLKSSMAEVNGTSIDFKDFNKNYNPFQATDSQREVFDNLFEVQQDYERIFNELPQAGTSKQFAALEDVKKVSTAVETGTASLKDYYVALKALGKELGVTGLSFKNIGKSFKTASTDLDAYNEILEETSKTGKVTGEQLEKLESIADSLRSEFRTAGEVIDGAISLIKTSSGQAGEVSEATFKEMAAAVGQVSNELKQAAAESDQTTQTFIENSTKIQVAQAELNAKRFSAESDRRGTGAKIAQLDASAAGSVSDGIANTFAGFEIGAMGVETFTNALKDGNMNMITFISSAGMLISSLQMIASVGKNVKAMTALSSILTNIGGKLPLIGAGAKAMGSSIAAGAATGGVALSTLLPIIAAVAAALFAITKIIDLVGKAFAEAEAKAYNASPEGRIDAATQAMERLNTSIGEHQTELDSLKSSYEGLSEARAAIDSCTQGTTEWTQAILDNNTKVLNLLDTYSQFFNMSDITIDENGVMSINEDAYRDAIEQYQNLIYGEQAQVIRESSNKIQAQIDQENEKMIDQLHQIGSQNTDQRISQALSDNFDKFIGDITKTYSLANEEFQKEIYESLGDVDFTFEDLQNYLNSNFSGEYSGVDLKQGFDERRNWTDIDAEEYNNLFNKTDFKDQLIKSINNATGEQLQNRTSVESIIRQAWGNMDTTDLGRDPNIPIENLVNRLAPVIEANSGEIARLNSELDVYSSQVNDSGKQLASIFTGNSDTLTGMSADEKAMYAGASAGVAQEYIDEALDTVIEAAQKDGTYSNKIKQYMAAQFGEDQDYSIEDDGIYLKDENGKVAKEAAVQFGEIFAQETMETAQESFDDYFNTVKKGLGSIKDSGQRTAAEEGLTGSGNVSLSSLNAYNNGQLSWLGINYPEMYSMIIDNMEQARDAWSKIGPDTRELAEQYQYSLDSAKKVEEINKMLDINDSDMEFIPRNNQIAEILTNIDWTEFDAANKAVNQLKSMGYEVDTTSESWQHFVDEMRSAYKAIPDLESLIDQLSSVKSITGDLELGSIISSEDYDTLVNFNSELSKYFAILADGSAQMIGDPLDLQQLVKENEQQQLQDAIDMYNSRAQDLSVIQDTQYSQNDEGKLVYDNANITTQLDYIQAYNPEAFTPEQFDEWREKLSQNANIATEDLDKIRSAFDALGVSSEQMTALSSQAMTSLAMSADSAAEREQLREAGAENGGIDDTAYGLAATQAINQEQWEGLDVDEVQEYADQLQEVAEESDLLSDSLKDNEEAAEDVARATMKMNDGIDKLADGFDDWSDVLKNSDESSEEYCDAMSNMKDAMSDVLGVSEEFLSDDFIIENMDDIAKAAEGDAEAIDRLQVAAANDILINITGQDNLTPQLENLQNTLLTSIPDDIEIGATLDSGDFLANANELVSAAGMTVEQAQAYFNSLGYEPTFEMRNERRTAPMYGERVFTTDPVIDYAPGPDGEPGMPYIKEMTTHKESVYMGEQEQNFVVPALSPDGTPKITELTKTSSGAMNNYSSANKGGGSPGKGGGKKGGGGGGGKKSTYKKPTPKVRYTNRDNQISRTQQTVDKLAQVEDQLYGKAKLAAMQKKSDLIVQQVKDYKALYDEAVAYREQDMQNLAATQLGQAVPMQIDAEGNILNQEEMDDYMREWKDRIDAIEDEGAKEAEQRAYDVSEQAYTYYKEAQKKALEAMKEAVSQLGEWISNEIEKRQYQMEIDIKVSDRQLSLLEFTLEELGSAGWITNWEDGLDNVIDQVDSIMNAGESTIDSTYKLIDLFDKVNNGGLGWDELDQDMKDMFPKDVWEEANENGTQTNEVLEAIGDNTDKLLDYAGQLTEAWVSAWEKIGEAMDSYLEKLERARAPLDTLSGALDTFISIADSRGWDIGRIEEYNKLLDKQTEILEANLEASQAQYQGTQEALAAMEPVYNDYLEKFENGEITGQQFDVIEEQYYNLVDANADAADQMYSDWDAYVSNLQEKFETMSEQIWKTWNDKLGNMWNDVLESQEGFDMYKTLENWYLDDFDKDYGLTTLTNQIEDAMSGITDPSRLKEYDAFMQEIVKKQEEGYNLSQGELDVLNAKFQLMQAQDAYEDARNNKNTMRLTRDASGNYSYVYSSEDTSDAEQQVLDAQKNVHDAEKAFQEESEANWYEYMLTLVGWVKDINWEMYENDEDYRRQVQEQWNQYIQAMNNAAHDVDIALGYTEVSFKDTVLGWITSCESMQEANSFYQDSTNELGNEVHQAWVDMDQKIEDSASLVMDSTNSMEDSMNDLMGTIDDAMGNMMDTADDLAENMGSNMSQMIEDTASWSDGIIDEINAVIAKYKELYEMQTSVLQNHTGQTKNYEWHMDGNNGQWYYGDNNGGYYKSGWMQIGDKWYFFDDQGYLDMGQDRGDGTFWVDNGHYQVDKDGAWIEGTIAEGHTPGDWAYGQDTKNWGQSYTDIANGTANGSLNFDAINTNIGIGSFSGHAGGPENAHWLQDEDGILWYYGTNDPSGNGNQGSYVDGWMKINGKWYHFDEDGWLDSYEDGQDEQDFDEGKQAYWKKYAKGGYTGNQGLRGVDTIPAMLAPGEYVLNHDDTTKILSAVQLLRGLSSGALAAAANAITKLANGSIPQAGQTEQIPVQQDVHIEATFPNVSVASEIEDALNNLVNETVQLIGSQNSRRL